MFDAQLLLIMMIIGTKFVWKYSISIWKRDSGSHNWPSTCYNAQKTLLTLLRSICTVYICFILVNTQPKMWSCCNWNLYMGGICVVKGCTCRSLQCRQVHKESGRHLPASAKCFLSQKSQMSMSLWCASCKYPLKSPLGSYNAQERPMCFQTSR